MKMFDIRSIMTLTTLGLSGLIANGQDLQSAKSLTRSERFEEAEVIYKNLMQKEANNADVYFYLGQNTINQYLADTLSISKKETLKVASDLFVKGHQTDSSKSLNLVGLGVIELLKNGDTTKADTYFNRAYRKLPAKASKYSADDVKTIVYLGSAQIIGKNKRHAKALTYLSKAEEATAVKNASVGTNPDVYLGLGDVYLSQKNYNEAIKNYRKALTVDKKFVEAQLRIGYLYLGAKNLNESRTAFEEAKTVDSTFAPVYRGLGEVYTAARQYKFAKDNYRIFLRLSGDNTAAKANYATSLFKSGEFDEAITTVEEVLAVDKSRNNLNRLATFSCYDKKPQDLAKGLKFSETFFAQTTPEKIIPKDYAYLGRIQLKLKKDSAMIDQGIDNLIKAYELDSSDVTLLNEAYKNSYYNKRYNKAVQLINSKIATGTADANDYMMLGKSYYQLNQYNKADSVFNQVSVKDPNNLDSYVWMANTASSMDPDSKMGLAKPKYEMVIKVAMADTVKNKAEMLNAYSYLASYYLKVKKDNNQTKNYAQKILNLDPTNKEFITRGYSFYSAIYIADKDYNNVKRVYNKLLEVEPNNADYKKMIDWANAGIESQKKK